MTTTSVLVLVFGLLFVSLLVSISVGAFAFAASRKSSVN